MTFTKRIKTILEEKKSKIVRRTLNPSFNLVLLLELESILDVKGLKIRITVHDYDKHTKVTELGAVTISTKMLNESLSTESNLDPVLELPLVPRIRDVSSNFIYFRVTFNMENDKPTTSYQNLSIF